MGIDMASKPHKKAGKRKLIIGKIVKLLIGQSAVGNGFKYLSVTYGSAYQGIQLPTAVSCVTANYIKF
jgi:hypothetical protein